MKNPFLNLALTTLLFTSSVFAQDQSNSANDPQAAAQQMRQTIIQNMMAKGIDPQEFFGQIRQQIQDGTFDPAELQQTMIDKGIIDRQMAEQMQTTMQSATMSRIREQVAASDAEWKVLQPKIQKVLVLLAAAAPPGQGAGMSMMMGAGVGVSPVAKATKDLRAALKDPHTSEEAFGARLRAWREAHEKAKTDLATAQKDLTDVLTVRQEAVLMQMGLIP
jgi:hypothetical protein